MQGNKRIKVCLVITKGVWGGAQRYVYDLAVNLPKDRFETIVVCGEGENLPYKLNAVGIRAEKLPSLTRDIGFISEIKSSWNLLKIIHKERPDVLHLSSPKAGGFGAVAGRLCGIRKIIYTVHGFAFNEDRNFFSKFLIAFFSWLTIFLSHKTVVIAEKEKKQALAMPFVKNKIVLIHNGIEKIIFKEKGVAREELLSKLKLLKARFSTISNDLIWIGAIAELHKNKGLQYAISAVEKINQPFAFFILGKGEERKNLENLVAKYNLQDKVFFVDFVEKASEYLKAFDIFLLPSVKEGLPYTILEAGLAGLPVIASKVGGVPDIIENGVSGILTTSGKSSEIARALGYLMQNPDKQKDFGQNLKEKVEKEFSLEQMLEKTEKLYRE